MSYGLKCKICGEVITDTSAFILNRHMQEHAYTDYFKKIKLIDVKQEEE